MIILVLLITLAGSAGTALTLFAKGAGLGAIALGYLSGGWAALLLAGAAFLLHDLICRYAAGLWPSARRH